MSNNKGDVYLLVWKWKKFVDSSGKESQVSLHVPLNLEGKAGTIIVELQGLVQQKIEKKKGEGFCCWCRSLRE